MPAYDISFYGFMEGGVGLLANRNVCQPWTGVSFWTRCTSWGTSEESRLTGTGHTICAVLLS